MKKYYIFYLGNFANKYFITYTETEKDQKLIAEDLARFQNHPNADAYRISRKDAIRLANCAGKKGAEYADSLITPPQEEIGDNIGREIYNGHLKKWYRIGRAY